MARWQHLATGFVQTVIAIGARVFVARVCLDW